MKRSNALAFDRFLYTPVRFNNAIDQPNNAITTTTPSTDHATAGILAQKSAAVSTT